MKIIITFAATVFALNLAASGFADSNFADKVCKESLIDLGNGNFRTTKPIVKIFEGISFIASQVSKNNSVLQSSSGLNFSSSHKITDFEVVNLDTILILTPEFLFNLDPVSNTYRAMAPTQTIVDSVGKYNFASGLAVKNSLAYIAHGELGISVVDLNLMKPILMIENDFNPGTTHRSLISDVEIAGNKLIAGVDNITYNFSDETRAFEGLAQFHLSNLSLSSLHRVNQKKEAYHLPKLYVDGQNLIVHNMFLLFVHPLKRLKSEKLLQPVKRIYTYKFGKPVGRPFIQSGKLSACFHKHTRETGITTKAMTQGY
ncbi:MAG: hypothetical protein AB8E15_02375 [Bdellovibrionales bacterium]